MKPDLLLKLAATYEELVGRYPGWATFEVGGEGYEPPGNVDPEEQVVMGKNPWKRLGPCTEPCDVPDYDPTGNTEYTTGDLVSYKGKLYQCKWEGAFPWSSPVSVLETISTGKMPASVPDYFDWKTFTSMPSLGMVHDYLGMKTQLSWMKGREQMLPFMGQGGHREVFELPGGKMVLKVAKNQVGMEQNHIESKISRDKRMWNYIAKVFEKHPKFYWIVSERVEPSGTSRDEIAAALQDSEFKQAAKEYQILTPDFFATSHWGKTSDGRTVIYDYGWTSPMDKFYRD